MLNGRKVEVPLPDETLTLLDVLRDFLHVTSPKNGCQPQAQCGCCTILLDGKAVLSCALRPEKAAGKQITTLEGLDERNRHMLSESFVQCGGVQCGYCIPGFAIRAVALCDKNPAPSREDILQACKPHLCRCTGYAQIVESIESYCAARRGEASPQPTPDDCSGRIGTSLARYTGHDAVLGDRKFIDDMRFDGMRYGALRLSDHPRATVRGIDPGPALALSGVHRVVTAADIPAIRMWG
jgi:xanthine dehydrogenase molybdenum-binding subunit